MKAQIAIEKPDRGSTVFPSMATGHVLRLQFPAGTGFDPLDGGSFLVFTDDAGRRNLDAVLAGEKRRGKVRDIVVGTTHTIERADCGLGCRCAARVVRSEATVL